MNEWVMVAGPVLIAAFCLGTLGAGLCLLVGAARFQWVADRAVGEVVRIHAQCQDVIRIEDSGSQSQRMLVHYPVIAFEDAEGVRQEVMANHGSRCTPGYRVGERVPILVARGNPLSMRINSFMSLYWNAACMLFMGGLSVPILAFWLFYLHAAGQ